MPRCCVPDCNSGSFKEVRKTKAAGLRQKSYFTFPKDEELLKKWMEIIFDGNNKIITNKLKICELHFHESDVMKYYETKLKDGTIHRIQRDKYTLRKGATPISKHQEEDAPINQIKHDIATEVIEDGNDNFEIIPTENLFINHNFNKNHSELSRQDKFNSIIKQSDSNSCNSKPNIINNLQYNDVVHNTQIKVYSGSFQRSKILLSKNPPIMSNIQKQIATKENNSHISCNEEIKFSRNCFSPNVFENNQDESNAYVQIDNVKSISNKENYDKMNDDCTRDYNFSRIKNDLQAKCLNISSSWAYAFQESTSVTLAYVHPLKQAIQLICTIDRNMNVKVATFDKRVIINVNMNFNTNTDFVNYLCELEKTKCCDGTGVTNIFSEKCQGFISSDEEYKRSRGYHRCNACRDYRKVILKKKIDSFDVDLRLREQTRKIKLLQFKYKQLQKLLSKKQKLDLVKSKHNLYK